MIPPEPEANRQEARTEEIFMMNKQGLISMWDMFRQKHGITLRLIEALPEDKLHTRPIPGMRTPAELVVHMYDIVVKGIPEGVSKGQVTTDESTEKAIAESLKTKRDLLNFVEECWNTGDRAATATTDQQLAAMIPTPWGKSMPGYTLYGVIGDEYLHHRGQLYAYTRALGVTPPEVWDFAHNAEAFRPKEMVTA
jgi:uncharacterized damage-inducible protein DinB